ncbi:MAG: ribosomal L7Ae/L30e/S12e/Gadd45 family protein [Clostridia bacterium]
MSFAEKDMKIESSEVKTAKKIVGLKQVMKNIDAGIFRCVMLASDCDDFIKNAVKEKVKTNKVCICEDYTKKVLGKLCEIDVDASIVGLINS